MTDSAKRSWREELVATAIVLVFLGGFFAVTQLYGGYPVSDGLRHSTRAVVGFLDGLRRAVAVMLPAATEIFLWWAIVMTVAIFFFWRRYR